PRVQGWPRADRPALLHEFRGAALRASSLKEVPMAVFRSTLSAVVAAALLAACNLAGARSKPVALPDPVVDVAADPAAKTETAVFAGGCFWGVEAVFEHVRGVKSAVSGYSGGSALSARYMLVST